MNTKDYQPSEAGLFALFKGDSGAGKTTGALSFPNPLIMDFDKKMPAIAIKHFPGKSVEYEHYTDIFQVADRLVELSTNCPYETLIADSLTHLVGMTMTSIAKVKGEETSKMLQRLKSKSIELMGIDYYNAETRFITYFVDQLKALHSQTGRPRHVIMIAHVITTESAPDLKSKLVTRSSSIFTMGRKVAATVPTVFDDMWHFGTVRPEVGSDDKRPHHVAITESVGEENAKTAYRLPLTIDFTDGSLYDQWIKSVNHQTPTTNLSTF